MKSILPPHWLYVFLLLSLLGASASSLFQTAGPGGARLALSAVLVLTPDFCAAKTRSISGNVDLGAMACAQLEPSLKNVFSAVSRVDEVPPAGVDKRQVVLQPRFADAQTAKTKVKRRELVVVLEWTVKDSSGAPVWIGTVQGSGKASNKFTRNKKKDRNRLGEIALKDAIDQSVQKMTAAPELRRLAP